MNNTASKPSPRWQQALDKHRNLLHDHLMLWSNICDDTSSDPALHSVAKACIHRTQAMITACADDKKSAMKIIGNKANGKTKRPLDEVEDQAPRKKIKKNSMDGATANKVAVDPSGLFMIDTTAIKVPDLQSSKHTQTIQPKASKKKVKPEPVTPPTLPAATTKESKGEKRKRRRASALKAVEEVLPDCNVVLLEPQSKRIKVERDESYQPEAAEAESGTDETYHQAFEAKVSLRLKQKEELRKEKASKKRKREDEDSAEEFKEKASDDPANEYLGSPKISLTRYEQLLTDALEVACRKDATITKTDIKTADRQRGWATVEKLRAQNTTGANALADSIIKRMSLVDEHCRLARGKKQRL